MIANPSREWGAFVPSYIVIPAVICAVSVGLIALIYWGGFVEERRNNETRVP